MPQHDVHSPVSWRWKRKENELYFPIWTTFPEASRSCNELVRSHVKLCPTSWASQCIY